METDYNSDEDLAELRSQDAFLDAWSEWGESGLLKEMKLTNMWRVLDIVEMRPQFQRGNRLHGNKSQEKCFCHSCRDFIMYWLRDTTTPSAHEFFEENIDALHKIWLTLGSIFPTIVDFKTFCVQAELKPEN